MVIVLLERLRTEGDLVEDPEVQPGVTADPDDDYLVAPARESGADGLVTGDPDILEPNLDDLDVLTPAEFLARLGDA